MKLELIGSPLSAHVQQCVAMLLHQHHNFQFVPLYDNPTPDWYLQISPRGVTPCLRLENEITLLSSPIILEYLSDVAPVSLQPDDPLKRAQHRMWRQTADDLDERLTAWLGSSSEKDFLRHQEDFFHSLRPIERHIQGPYFCGSNPGLVDFAWVPLMTRLQFVESRGIMESYWNRHPEFYTWYLTLAEQNWFVHSVPKNFDELLAAMLNQQKTWITQLDHEIVLR